MVVHLGVIVIAVAFAASSSYVRQAEFSLLPGDSVEFAGHTVTYLDWEVDTTSARTELEALVTIDGAGPYAPALTRFDDAGQTVGTPSVRSSLDEDVHLSLLDSPDEETDQVRLRVTVQPLVYWLWVGGGVMIVGAVLSAIPGRRPRPGRGAGPPSDRRSDRDEGRVVDGPSVPEVAGAS
jgi:cytochrome c-type biogenesis protein CcmF